MSGHPDPSDGAGDAYSATAGQCPAVVPKSGTAGASVGRMVVIGLVWFTSSALYSTWANTAYLIFFKDPLLHTFIRFFGSAFVGLLTLLSTGEVVVSELPTMCANLFVPAILLWAANYANSISLQLAGITLTYVVKACIPVFTVVSCTLLGQKFPIIIYISLIPICFGVILASGADVNVSTAGLCAATVSALSQTFMNISIKSVREKTGYSGQKSFLGMTIVATLTTLPVVAVSSMSLNDGSSQTTVDLFLSVFTRLAKGDSWPLLLTILAAVAYHVEYVLNFTFVSYVSSVTFSVCDIARRIAIILTGAVVFNKVLTMQNWTGIIIALGGVLWYSYLDNATKTKAVPEAVGAHSQDPNESTRREVSNGHLQEGRTATVAASARARNQKSFQK
jgi:drug/metabolite transporter (DMT)-like permease